nr:MAG TPA: hypothetical protein [Bacteriophage sp.]
MANTSPVNGSSSNRSTFSPPKSNKKRPQEKPSRRYNNTLVIPVSVPLPS